MGAQCGLAARGVCQHTSSCPLNWEQLAIQPPDNPIMQVNPLKGLSLFWLLVGISLNLISDTHYLTQQKYVVC
jgi:hypothetical protein